MAGALLALVLLQLALAIRRAHVTRIGLSNGGYARAALLWRWSLGLLVTIALPDLIGLALLGRIDALATMPWEFWDSALVLGQAGGGDPYAGPLMIGLLGGTAVNLGMVRWRLRRGRPLRPVRGAEGLVPLRRGDLPAAAMLSLAAGLGEELRFRLFLPLLIALVTGSTAAAFAVSTILFGLVHRYQGVRGIVVTTIVGALLGAFYLASGDLWLAMLFHTAIDLNALVVRPIGGGAWRLSASAASPS